MAKTEITTHRTIAGLEDLSAQLKVVAQKAKEFSEEIDKLEDCKLKTKLSLKPSQFE